MTRCKYRAGSNQPEPRRRNPFTEGGRLLSCAHGLDFEYPTRSRLFLTQASSPVRRLLLFIRKVAVFFTEFRERLLHRDLYCRRYKITHAVIFTLQLASLK